MKLFLAVLFLIMFFVSPVIAQQAPDTYAVVTFTAPTTRIDNTLFCSFVGQQYCPYAGMVFNPAVVAPDGTHPVEILKYSLYYGETTPPTTKLDLAVGVAPAPISGLVSSETYTVHGLKANTLYYFGATATDMFNQESSMSTIVSKLTPSIPAPSAPANFKAPNTGRK